MKFEQPVPILRMFDTDKANEFYQTFSENGNIDNLDQVLGDPINKETVDIIAKAAAAKKTGKTRRLNSDAAEEEADFETEREEMTRFFLVELFL